MPRLKNKRWERFARNYVANGFKGAKAARAVGCSTAACRQMASEWLAKPNISARVAELTEDLYDDIEMTKQELIDETNKLAKFNPQDLIDSDGKPIPLHELDPDVAASVGEVAVDSETLTVYATKAGKDKRAAIDMGLRIHNAYEDHQKAGNGEIHIHLDDKDSQA